MKKKRKYQKVPEKPNKSCYIRIRVTEEQYTMLQERAKKSSYKNLSAWGRHRLLSDKSTSVAPDFITLQCYHMAHIEN